MIKKLTLALTVVAFFGCANGKWNTGSASFDAALAAAQGQLAGQVATVATQVAQGSDVKTALVQASGDALRSLEATGMAAIQPTIQEQLAKWVPKTPQWQNYAHNVAGIVSTYVANHGNNYQVLNAALEAVAITLNNF